MTSTGVDWESSAVARPLASGANLPVLDSIAEVVDVVAHCRETVFVRFSKAPPDGLDETSVDHETGIHLPGLSVNPLDPPTWWGDRSLEEWVVRRICTYAHLQEDDPSRTCWIVEGAVVERGPDNEPLIAPRRPVAVIARTVVAECMQRRVGAGFEDRPTSPPPWQELTQAVDAEVERDSTDRSPAGSGLSHWIEVCLTGWEPAKRRLAAVRMLWLSVGLMVLNVALYLVSVFDDSNLILVTLILSWLAITLTAADLVATTDVREDNDNHLSDSV